MATYTYINNNKEPLIKMMSKRGIQVQWKGLAYPFITVPYIAFSEIWTDEHPFVKKCYVWNPIKYPDDWQCQYCGHKYTTHGFIEDKLSNPRLCPGTLVVVIFYGVVFSVVAYDTRDFRSLFCSVKEDNFGYLNCFGISFKE